MLTGLGTGPATTQRRSARRRRFGAVLVDTIAIACTLGVAACSKPPPPAQQAPDVKVAEVVQRDVPVSAEWVGTTDGYINAQIRANVRRTSTRRRATSRRRRPTS